MREYTSWVGDASPRVQVIIESTESNLLFLKERRFGVVPVLVVARAEGTEEGNYCGLG